MRRLFFRAISARIWLPQSSRGRKSMLRTRRLERAFAIGAAAVAIFGSIGNAAEVYPVRPITMVVPYAAAGLFDALARVLAEAMRTGLSQSVVIENIGGASGSIAAGRLARAAPDGYTIGIGSGDQFVVNAAIYSLQYDVVKDFEPVALLMNGPLLIVGKNALPNNLKELIPWLKANRATVAFAHNGAGGALHLCGLALQRAGLLRAYAVTGSARLTSAPDIPTVDEAGLAELHISVWGGVFAPKGTPQNVIAKLNAALVDALADPAVRQKFVDLGQEIFPREQQTPEALAALQKAEIEKWWPIIKAANVKGE